MRGVSKRFGPTVALKDIDLSVAPGEVHALIGENGAGKSTLMNILSGSIRPDSGTMILAGADYQPRGPLDARRHGVTMVHQELALAPHLSVAENLFLGTELTSRGILQRGEMHQRTRAALRELDHEDIPPSARVGTLSVAAQQIVEIARALIVDTKVLILDEPTSSLPQRDVGKLFRLIKRLKARGLAILYISHFLEEVKEIADRYTVLRDGEMAGTGDITGTTLDKLIFKMVGRDIDDLFPRSERTFGETLLQVEGLAGDVLPREAGFALREGEVLGIAGLMGAGRTEMLRALFGLDRVRSGKITVGVYSGAASPHKRLAQGIGLLSEDRKEEGLAGGLTLTDNLTLSRMDPLGSLGLVSPM
jgi:ribose transport system ATP-binding protein